jgi:hypothetical protein
VQAHRTPAQKLAINDFFLSLNNCEKQSKTIDHLLKAVSVISIPPQVKINKSRSFMQLRKIEK